MRTPSRVERSDTVCNHHEFKVELAYSGQFWHWVIWRPVRYDATSSFRDTAGVVYPGEAWGLSSWHWTALWAARHAARRIARYDGPVEHYTFTMDRDDA
jgi:hypothetical protein